MKSIHRISESFRRPFRSVLAAAAMAASMIGGALLAADTPQATKGDDSLELQAARAKSMSTRGHKVAYKPTWDLSGLPHYVPKEQVSGTIRMWGSNYVGDGDLGRYWEAGFRKYQPGIKFEYHLKAPAAAVPALYTGVADISPSRKINFEEILAFQRIFDYNPTEISYATGAFDVPGWNPSFAILINRDNPIKGLTMRQLDDIFGSERLGGWLGTSWHPEFARGPEENIRTWGQLGATGEWADRQITPYGLNQRYHQATEISDMILKGSDKWNERLRVYANYVKPDGTLGRTLMADLVKDSGGIAYVAGGTKDLPPEEKVIPIAVEDGGPYIMPSIESVHDRSYPLHDEVYMYLNRTPGKPVDPKVREYVAYILSQEGQTEVMRDGKYLPLAADVARAELRKVE